MKRNIAASILDFHYDKLMARAKELQKPEDKKPNMSRAINELLKKEYGEPANEPKTEA